MGQRGTDETIHRGGTSSNGTRSSDHGTTLPAEREEVTENGTGRKAASLDMRPENETPVHLLGTPLTTHNPFSSFRLCGLAAVVASAVVTAVAGFLAYGSGRSGRISTPESFTVKSEPVPPFGGYSIKEGFYPHGPKAPGPTVLSAERSVERSPRRIRTRRALQGLGVGAVMEDERRDVTTVTRREGDSRIRRRAVAIEVGADVGAGDGGGVVAREFPSVDESTIMFLHVFKCAGSTLRRMLVDWAEADGHRGAIVHKCDYTSEEREVCLDHYQLVDEAAQREQISRLKVLAGHFIWGFQRHVQGPYLMITALRNPLEVFVSAQQYLNRKQTKTLEKAHKFVAEAMRNVVKSSGSGTGTTNGIDNPHQRQLGGYIRRFVGKDKNELDEGALEIAAGEAVRNLDTFWIVGVVEQYAGFEEVLKRSLDPRGQHQQLWDKYASRQFNSSPVGSRDVLAAIDPELVREFNGSLALQWRVYEEAVDLWSARCQEVLPSAVHQEMCRVPSPAETYYVP